MLTDAGVTGILLALTPGAFSSGELKMSPFLNNDTQKKMCMYSDVMLYM